MKLVKETIRCAEKFHGRPKFDNCLVRQSNGMYSIARMLSIFRCTAAGRSWNLARVRLYQTVGQPSAGLIGMRRVKEDRYGFIDLTWIIRSVFLSPTFVARGEYFLNDLVDSDDNPSDMYLRLREIPQGSWY
jgi:hypothetical protein